MTALKPKHAPAVTWEQRANALRLRSLLGKWTMRNMSRVVIPHEGKREVARRQRQIAQGLLLSDVAIK